MANLTGGETPDANHPGSGAVFNAERYPGLWHWYYQVEDYFASLPSVETKDPDWNETLHRMKEADEPEPEEWLLPTPSPTQSEVDAKCGLVRGKLASIAPDDTGKADPTVGTLVASSPEEFVITPQRLEKPPLVDVRVHFPRLAFVARPADKAKL